jgi:outer membrane receptor protein involved in Fe transport
MKKRLDRVFVLTVLIAFSVSLLSAQTIPTGKLDGYVVDDGGLALPGATVTISSPSLIGPPISNLCSEKGYYRFIGLPSGSYKVTFELPGFKHLVREGIIVTAGKSTTLNVTLEQSALEETVVVQGQAPTVNLQDTATGATFGKETLMDLPVGRTVDSVANLAPGMYEEAAHGSDQLTNRYSIDGQNQSHPLHGVIINEVGFSGIEEITVETGLHKAEYGGVMGAVVQVITKSGGNDFSGEIGVYSQTKGLQSDNTKGTPFEGKFIGFDYEHQPNFTLGGPIKRDQAWFFINMDMRSYRYFVQGYPYDQTEHLPIDSPRYRPFGKLTWQISPKDKLVTSVSYTYTGNDHSGANLYNIPETTAKAPEWGITFSSQWTRVFSPDFLLNARVGYFYNFGDRILKSDEVRVQNLATSRYTGSGGYNHENKRGRVQFSTDSSYFVEDWNGSHEFKVGGEAGFSWNGSNRTWNRDPYWEGIFGEYWRVSTIYHRNEVPERIALTENYFRKEQIINVGLFAQDTWALSKNIILNLGLRYDFAQTVWPKQKKGDTDIWAYEKRTVAMTWNTLAPRLGISFDPGGDGRTVLKASYGRYYAAHTTMLTNIAYGGGSRSLNARLNPDWTVAYTYGYSEPTGAVNPDGLNPYYNDTINFGIERELFKDFALGVTYIRKWEKNMIEGVDEVHVDTADLKKNGVDDGNPKWIGYVPVQGTDPLTGNPVTFYSMDPSHPTNISLLMMNIPGVIRDYQGVEVKATKRVSNNWGMYASYVWSKGKGLLGTNRFDSDGASAYFNEPNIHINAWGVLKHQRHHVVKAQGTYIAPFGIQLSAQYIFMTGEPYPRQLRTSEAGAKLYQGTVTIAVEPYGAYHYPDIHELNLRVQKSFNIGPGQFIVIGDVFRALNAQTVTGVGWRTGLDWQRVTSIVNPRYFRLGLVYRF